MPLIQQYGLSALQSESVSLNISNVDPIQHRIAFNGGYSFNFVDLLSGGIDTCSKNYSNFYLTRKTLLDSNTESDSITFNPDNILTRIAVGGSSLKTQLLSSSDPSVYNYQYNLQFTNLSSDYFDIEFVDGKYCTVSYSDAYSKNYLVLDSNALGYMKRGIFLDSTSIGAQHFRYILNKNNLILLKDVGSTTLQLRSINGVLSGAVLAGNVASNLSNYYFTIDNELDITQTNSNNVSFIQYNDSNIDIDAQNSEYDIPNNFLLYRNLDRNSVTKYDILVLKNQMDEYGNLSRCNNLALSGGILTNDLRTYTSIANDIDTVETDGLDINYSYNNKSINILPGVNYITTEASLFPFTQININDTKFIQCGAFSSLKPMYSDRVYIQDKNNLGDDALYLCTWLSGAPTSTNKIWVDRYYYPDIVSKKAALQGQAIYSATYTSYVENLIANNSALSSSIVQNQYFDKKSDLAFIPSSTYIYERVNLNALQFSNKNIIETNMDGYYSTINSNGGYTLAFDLLNLDDDITRVFYSEHNDIDGGLKISYTGTDMTLQYKFYDTAYGTYSIYTKSSALLIGTNNNIVINVDNRQGFVQCTLNGSILMDARVPPLYYNNVLYGDFTIEGNSIFDAQDYIKNAFLTDAPLPAEEVALLIASGNDSNTPFHITLPCGMRNKVDIITHINSLTTNLKSKSNAINIYINNLGIDSSEISQSIKESIMLGIEDILPINTSINTIEILS